MINAKRARQDLPQDLIDDAAIMKDLATLTEFLPLVTAITATAAGPIATLTAVAGSIISSSARVIKRLSQRVPEVPSEKKVWHPYSRFRLVFYVLVQRSYFESLNETLEARSTRNLRSKNARQLATSQLSEEFLAKAATLDEAEVRFHFSIDPGSSELPLYDAYADWLTPILRRAGFDAHQSKEILETVDSKARERLSAYVASSDSLGQWIRSYLALEYERATVRELRSIREVLVGWIDEPRQRLREEQRSAWERYKNVLRTLPDQRGSMFAEDFGVREVFVDPAVTYWRSGVPGTPDRSEEPPSVWQLLGALLSTRPRPEDLIFVCGGPGCGKSTLCRLLASELATHEEIQPIFIRLRRYKEGADFAAFLEDTLAKQGLMAKLFELESLANVVLILDGFDETAMASRARLRHLFSVLLEDLRSGPLREARVVISGRDTLFPGGQGFPRGSHVLTLKPFDDERIAAWGRRWRAKHAGSVGAEFFPETLVQKEDGNSEGQIEHLLRWPLTLHLLARTFSSGRLRLDGEVGKMAKPFLYRQILADTADRQAEQAQGSGRLLPEDMLEFLRQLAWEMYTRGVDTLELHDVEPVLARLQRFEAGTLDELTEVAIVNSPELKSGEETGIEFVHKSFAEYLVAEVMAAKIEEICEELPSRAGRGKKWRYRPEEAARLSGDLVNWRVIPAEVQEMLQPILGWWTEFARRESSQKDMDRNLRATQLTLIRRQKTIRRIISSR